MSKLTETKNQLLDYLSMGNTLGEQSEQKTAFVVGKIDMINMILSMTYEDINPLDTE